MVKNPLANAGDIKDEGSIPGQEDPRKRACQPTSVFLPENPMDRGTWSATVHGVAESDMAEAT